MDYQKIVYNFFVSKLGKYGAAGLIGNLIAESGCFPARLQGDFSKDYIKSLEYTMKVDGGQIGETEFVHKGPGGGGYGLAQWTFPARKQKLYNYCKKVKNPAVSICDINAQIEYLYQELTDYKLVEKLKNSKSVLEASNIILHEFEKPRDQSSTVEQQRAKLGQGVLDKMGGTVSSAPTQTPALTPVAPTIIKQTSSVNTSARSGKIEWIVVHYTAGTTSRKGVAKNIATYFSKGTAKASADYIVDDGPEIIQYNPDPISRYTWAVGGSRYQNKSTKLSGQYYGKCKNNNSISIELCSSKQNTKTLNATDSDWYFTENVLNNGVKLVKYLMQLYNIDIEHVIMHHQVSGKMCPAIWTRNDSCLQGWYDFTNRIKNDKIKIEESIPQSNNAAQNSISYKVKITTKSLNVRKGPSTSYPIITTVHENEVYTIIEEQGSFGKLKSGIGWIGLKYTQKI